MDIIFIVLLGLLFATVLTGPLGWRHSRSVSGAGAWTFTLLVLLPLLWLALIWLPPAGPTLFGVYWLSPLLIGLLVVFLLGAAAPTPRRLRRGEEPRAGQDQIETAGATAIFVDAMFWLFFLAALALLAVGLLR